ncbi:MAG TPA: PA0069 family radical SAM protein [Steroidobacteraceae bacterium]|jgi:DNA repair photolyase|nr:PA0069 family radical SAM protein [Steroidobacteraceae bacterium]
MPRLNDRPRALKGHGALSNPPPRFDLDQLTAVDDGWYQETPPEHLETTLQPDRARGLITTNDSPDVPFERSINPYRGCASSCAYCFARPSHAYLGLSPGLDFETRLFYKADAARILEAELARPGYVCKPIMLGVNTDAYQPVERRMRVTRSILEVLERARHPVALITKHALVLRDLDLLSSLARDNLTSVTLSVTTLDHELKRRLEPQTASPEARLRTIAALNAAGVPAGVLVAPVIPALTDHELERILEACAAAGARWAGYVLLRLPYEIKDLFREWLAEHYPQRAAHVMALVRDMRGGRDNDPRFGSRMRGTGPYALLLRSRFQLAARRLGLDGAAARGTLDTTRFRPPGPGGAQLRLGL